MNTETIFKILPVLAWVAIVGILSSIAYSAGDWSLLIKGLLLVILIELIDKKGRETLGNTWLRTVVSLGILLIAVMVIF